MGGYAWVTLATNDSYSLGAMVLAHSLRRVGTKHDLVILVSPGVTAVMRERLAEVFSLVKEVNLLDSKDKTNLSLLARPELGVTFTKIHCWRLTQYEKCVFLDADTLVVKNCDELFEREELSAAPDVGWPDCFNSGVFVFKPSEETYDSIAAFAVAKGSFDGGDQGLLNMYFSDWAWKDISKHLPFIYNMCSMATYSYLPAFKQFGEDVRIIHFIGKTKPWLQHFDTLTGLVHPSGDSHHLRPLLQLWWSIFATNVHPQLSPVMARSTLATNWHLPTSQFFFPTAPVYPPSNPPATTARPCDDHGNYESRNEPLLPDFSEFKDPWENYYEPQEQVQGPKLVEAEKFHDRRETPGGFIAFSEHSKSDEVHFVHDHFQEPCQSLREEAHGENYQKTNQGAGESHEQSWNQQYHDFQQQHYHQDHIGSQQQHFHQEHHESQQQHFHQEHHESQQQHFHQEHHESQQQHFREEHHESQEQHFRQEHHESQQQHFHQAHHESQQQNSHQQYHDAQQQSYEQHLHQNHDSRAEHENSQGHLQLHDEKHQDIRWNGEVGTPEHRTETDRRDNVENNNWSRNDLSVIDCNIATKRQAITARQDDSVREVVSKFPVKTTVRKTRSAPSSRSPKHPRDKATIPDKTGRISDSNAGLAGALAQMKLGEARSPEQIALEEHMRKQSWEEGHVDYMGRDSFDNIWKKISETLSLAPQRQPTPPKDEAEPEETVKEATATSLEKKEEDVRQAEVIDESAVDASLISKTPVENVAAEGTPVTSERPLLLGRAESRQDFAKNDEIPGTEQPVPPQTLLQEKENVPVDAGETEESAKERELSSATMDKGLGLEVSAIPAEKVVAQKDMPVLSTERSESCSIAARNLGQQQVVAVPTTALVKATEQTTVSVIPEQRADKTSRAAKQEVEKEVIQQVYALPDIPPKDTALEKGKVIAEESPKPDSSAKSPDFERQLSERIALAAETTSASPVPIQVAESVLQTEPKTALESREGDLVSEEAISTVIAPVCDIATQSAEILHENEPRQVAAAACNGSGRLELEKDLLGPQEASQTAAQPSVEPRSEEKLLTETSAQGRVVGLGSIAEPRETRRQEEVTTTSKQEEVTVEASKVPIPVPTEVKGTKSEQAEVVKPEETVEKELKAEEKKSVTTMYKSESKEEPEKEEEVVAEAEVEAVKTPEAEVPPSPASQQQPEKPERSSRTKDQPDAQAKSTKKTTKKLTTKKSSESETAEGVEDVEKKSTKKLTKKLSESEIAEGAEDGEKKTTKKVVKKVPKKPKEGQEEVTESSSSGEKPKKPAKLTKKSSKSGQTQEAEASAPETTPDAPVPPKRKVKTTSKSAKPEAE